MSGVGWDGSAYKSNTIVFTPSKQTISPKCDRTIPP